MEMKVKKENPSHLAVRQIIARLNDFSPSSYRCDPFVTRKNDLIVERIEKGDLKKYIPGEYQFEDCQGGCEPNVEIVHADRGSIKVIFVYELSSNDLFLHIAPLPAGFAAAMVKVPRRSGSGSRSEVDSRWPLKIGRLPLSSLVVPKDAWDPHFNNFTLCSTLLCEHTATRNESETVHYQLPKYGSASLRNATHTIASMLNSADEGKEVSVVLGVDDVSRVNVGIACAADAVFAALAALSVFPRISNRFVRVVATAVAGTASARFDGLECVARKVPLGDINDLLVKLEGQAYVLRREREPDFYVVTTKEAAATGHLNGFEEFKGKERVQPRYIYEFFFTVPPLMQGLFLADIEDVSFPTLPLLEDGPVYHLPAVGALWLRTHSGARTTLASGIWGATLNSFFIRVVVVADRFDSEGVMQRADNTAAELDSLFGGKHRFDIVLGVSEEDDSNKKTLCVVNERRPEPDVFGAWAVVVLRGKDTAQIGTLQEALKAWKPEMPRLATLGVVDATSEALLEHARGVTDLVMAGLPPPLFKPSDLTPLPQDMGKRWLLGTVRGAGTSLLSSKLCFETALMHRVRAYVQDFLQKNTRSNFCTVLLAKTGQGCGATTLLAWLELALGIHASRRVPAGKTLDAAMMSEFVEGLKPHTTVLVLADDDAQAIRVDQSLPLKVLRARNLRLIYVHVVADALQLRDGKTVVQSLTNPAAWSAVRVPQVFWLSLKLQPEELQPFDEYACHILERSAPTLQPTNHHITVRAMELEGSVSSLTASVKTLLAKFERVEPFLFQMLQLLAVLTLLTTEPYAVRLDVFATRRLQETNMVVVSTTGRVSLLAREVAVAIATAREIDANDLSQLLQWWVREVRGLRFWKLCRKFVADILVKQRRSGGHFSLLVESFLSTVCSSTDEGAIERVDHFLSDASDQVLDDCHRLVLLSRVGRHWGQFTEAIDLARDAVSAAQDKDVNLAKNCLAVALAHGDDEQVGEANKLFAELVVNVEPYSKWHESNVCAAAAHLPAPHCDVWKQKLEVYTYQSDASARPVYVSAPPAVVALIL